MQTQFADKSQDILILFFKMISSYHAWFMSWAKKVERKIKFHALYFRFLTSTSMLFAERIYPIAISVEFAHSVYLFVFCGIIQMTRSWYATYPMTSPTKWMRAWVHFNWHENNNNNKQINEWPKIEIVATCIHSTHMRLCQCLVNVDIIFDFYQQFID